MKYLLIEFTKGLEQQAYQVIDDSGSEALGYVDLQGNELILPEVTESRVVNHDYIIPEFLNV